MKTTIIILIAVLAVGCSKPPAEPPVESQADNKLLNDYDRDGTPPKLIPRPPDLNYRDRSPRRPPRTREPDYWYEYRQHDYDPQQLREEQLKAYRKAMEQRRKEFGDDDPVVQQMERVLEQQENLGARNGFLNDDDEGDHGVPRDPVMPLPRFPAPAGSAFINRQVEIMEQQQQILNELKEMRFWMGRLEQRMKDAHPEGIVPRGNERAPNP